MRTVFLADAHLQAPGDHNYRLLLQFLQEQHGTLDVLCILGDLFDFRIGLPALSFVEQEPVLEALSRLSSGGTRLIYLEGNHDFHLGAAFAERIGAELQTGPFSVELQGKRVLLCHGDLANPADWRYRVLYALLRNRLVPLIGGCLPAGLVHGIRRRLQRSSRSRYTRDRTRWDYPQVLRRYAEQVRQQGYDALVLGHFHLPLIEQHGTFTLLALGDWISQFSYGELRDGVFSLTTYRP